jgi:hypothetical protein
MPPLRVAWVGPAADWLAGATAEWTRSVTVLPADASAVGGRVRLARWLRRQGADVVVVAGPDLPPHLVRWTRWSRVPLVWVRPPDASTPRVWPSAVLGPSWTALADVPQTLLRAVLPVPVPDAMDSGPPTWGHLRTIGAYGAAHAGAGLDWFIEAFARAFPDPGRQRAVVAVEQPAGAEAWRRLRSHAGAWHVSERVQLTAPGDLQRSLTRLDVWVHCPSTPSVTTEPVVAAMAAGLPVIVMAGGADAEVVTHDVDGVVVQAGSVGDLTFELSRLDLDRARRSRLAQGALRRAMDFRPERTADALIAVLHQVTGRT